jgi:diguanylate cyclase (GGDEF)-like protein
MNPELDLDHIPLTVMQSPQKTNHQPAGPSGNSPSWPGPEPAQLGPQLVQTFHDSALSLTGAEIQRWFDQNGRMGSALEYLQANLQQLIGEPQDGTTDDVAGQEVGQSAGHAAGQAAFMRDFAAAFDVLVQNLRQTHAALEQRAAELADGRRAALNLMLDAQAARREAEEAYTKLQAKVEQIEMLQARLREEAIRDPITGCFNRRYLEETLQREFSRAQRESYPLSLAMIDIDHFKIVNDTYGHPAGDAMLQILGLMLRSQTRAGDFVCRYGGDEFLLVLPNMRLQDALHRAETWRGSFQETEICYDEQILQASLSMGVACFPQHGTQSEAVILAADRALYRAKNGGRNRVVSA